MCLLGLWTHNHREFCCMSRLCGVQLWQDNCKVVVLLLCEWLLPRKIDGHTMSACLFLFSQFLSEQKQYCLHSSLASCSSALNPKWQPPLKTLAQWNHDTQRRAHQCFGWPIKWMEKVFSYERCWKTVLSIKHWVAKATEHRGWQFCWNGVLFVDNTGWVREAWSLVMRNSLSFWIWKAWSTRTWTHVAGFPSLISYRFDPETFHLF